MSHILVFHLKNHPQTNNSKKLSTLQKKTVIDMGLFKHLYSISLLLYLHLVYWKLFFNIILLYQLFFYFHQVFCRCRFILCWSARCCKRRSELISILKFFLSWNYCCSPKFLLLFDVRNKINNIRQVFCLWWLVKTLKLIHTRRKITLKIYVWYLLGCLSLSMF